MKSRKRYGVNAILTRGTVIFVCLMLAALWICMTVFLDDFYLLIKKLELRRAEKSIISSLENGVPDAEKAETIGGKYGVCFDAYLMRGNTATKLASADALPHCLIHNTDEKTKFVLYEKAKENGGNYLEYFRFDPEKRVYTGVGSPRTGKDYGELSMIRAVTVKKDSGDLLMILNSTVSPVSSAVSTLYVLLSVFTVVILILSFVFSRYLSGKITGPLTKLTEAADAFGKGDTGADFRVRGYAEAEKLSNALAYASEEINKTETLRRDFIANVSHDLRTPVTLITGYSEMMRDIPGENTPENLSNIVKEANRLSDLVSDVLDYSKLISGTVQLDMRPFCITEQLRDITDSYSEMLRHDGFELTLSTNRDVYVNGDPSQLGRVIINFISNAVSHSGENKNVEIAQTEENGWVRISVTDHGEGIPEEKLADIWERYYKVGQNPGRSKGTGLGLSIVKAITELHGGAYGVQSTVGKGSRFWYALRICENPDAGAE